MEFLQAVALVIATLVAVESNLFLTDNSPTCLVAKRIKIKKEVKQVELEPESLKV